MCPNSVQVLGAPSPDVVVLGTVTVVVTVFVLPQPATANANPSANATPTALLTTDRIRPQSSSGCEDLGVPDTFEIRPARESDRMPLALLFAGVAEELDWIATEPPVDVGRRAAAWTIEAIVVAVADEEIAGFLHLERSRHGYGEVALAVAPEYRGYGIGTALLEVAIDTARAEGLHKLSLSVFAHNEGAIGLYR
jgi:GNAT superfamily N-acetyltransferase